MNLFSRLFRTTGRTLSPAPAMVSASAANDLPRAAGNGAPPVPTELGPAALDFDMLECECTHAVAALIGANEVY